MKTRLKEPETQIVTMQSLMSAFLRHCANDNMCWLMDRKAIAGLCCCFVVVVGLLVRCDSSACGLYVVCVHVSGDRSFRFVDLRLVRAFARV